MFAQDQRLQRNVEFILLIELSTLSKTSMFLSRQIIQKMYWGDYYPTLFMLLPMKDSCQESRGSPHKVGISNQYQKWLKANPKKPWPEGKIKNLVKEGNRKLSFHEMVNAHRRRNFVLRVKMDGH